MSVLDVVNSVREHIKDAIDESKKETKRSVNYSKGMKSKHCGICEYFEVKAKNKCLKVKGEIRQDMWCKLFKKET